MKRWLSKFSCFVLQNAGRIQCRKNKVKAYALVYVLLTTLLIASICTFLLLSLSQHYEQRARSKHFSRLVHEHEHIFRLLKSRYFHFTGENIEKLNKSTFDPGIKSITSHSKWGLFDLVKIESRLGSDTLIQVALMGTKDYPYKGACLYLAENKVPLNISGKALLKGDAYLPSSGIRAALVNGRSYQREEYVFGQIHRSNADLPELNTDFLELPEGNTFQNTGEITWTDSLERSFREETVILDWNSPAPLSGMTLKGNIILRSGDTLRIGDYNHLEDILIIAPVIEFHGGNSFYRLQAFARKGIYLAEGTKLNYPSVLFIDRGGNQNGQIALEAGSSMSGMIYAKQDDPKSPEVMVQIGEDSDFEGLLYSRGITELCGNLQGTLVTGNLQYRFGDNLYRSFIVDSKIDATGLHKAFGVADLYGKGYRKSIIQWLN
jgi:hypothetical protein